MTDASDRRLGNSAFGHTLTAFTGRPGALSRRSRASWISLAPSTAHRRMPLPQVALRITHIKHVKVLRSSPR